MGKTNEQKVAVDHPEEGERISGSHYAFRIGTLGDTEHVEVSIDKGPWQACRPAAGYWWYDWSDDVAGEHSISARAQTKDGKNVKSQPRRFWLNAEPAETVSAAAGSR